jgi:multimeric flavodoxin WrbA
MPEVRKGQTHGKNSREEFQQHFQRSFFDPAFDAEREAITRLEEIAWKAYCEGRKAPCTVKAGGEFADPNYDLSVEWLGTRNAIRDAERRQRDAGTRSRVLLVCGSSRNDGTCPGEMSKTYRLTQAAEQALREHGIEVDLLDLSRMTSDYGRKIHPCKACVSTAMPLCHWPCSCYPNHATGQADDWMAEIYPRWAAAHGVMIVTPVYWDQAPSSFKLMMDRLVCADGGNPDPTRTSGKDPEKAKEIELQGWKFPKHLAGRVYGVAVHGDVSGVEKLRQTLCDWLDWMGLIKAGACAGIDRYIGYFQPYAVSHEALDQETAVFEEVRNVARAVATAVADLRAGKLLSPDRDIMQPRFK